MWVWLVMWRKSGVARCDPLHYQVVRVESTASDARDMTSNLPYRRSRWVELMFRLLQARHAADPMYPRQRQSRRDVAVQKLHLSIPQAQASLLFAAPALAHAVLRGLETLAGIIAAD